MLDALTLVRLKRQCPVPGRGGKMDRTDYCLIQARSQTTSSSGIYKVSVVLDNKRCLNTVAVKPLEAAYG